MTSALRATIVRGRRSASLDVAQDCRARLVAGALFECVGHELADPSELGVAEGVDLAAGDREGALLGDGTLGHDDDRREATFTVTLLELGRDLVDVERLFRDEDLGGAAGHAGVHRDPAGVAAHHLADEHAVVRLGGRVQAVDRVGRNLHRGVEAERDLSGREVVVDRLRDSDDVHAGLRELVRDAERVVAPDGDERVDVVLLQRRFDGLDAPLDLVGIGPRRTQDGPAPGQDAAAELHVERAGEVLGQALPAVTEADEAVAVLDLALADHGPDHGIEPGTVAAAGEHSDSHYPSKPR
jgi:hypothetical protein